MSASGGWPRSTIMIGLFFTSTLLLFARSPLPDALEEPEGPVATAAVQAIIDEADRLRDEKDAEAALAAGDRALATARKHDDAAGEAFAHRERAKALEALDRTDEALSAWQETASSWESLRAAPELIEAFCARLFLFARQRDSETLKRELERVVTIAQGERDRPQAVVDELNDASERMWRVGQLLVAEELARTAVAIADDHAIRPLDVASSLNSLGVVSLFRGDLKKARSFFQQVLGIRNEHAPGSLAVASSLNNLGLVVVNQGDFEAALGYYRRSLEIREQLAPGSLDVAASLSNLGGVAELKGDLDSAHDYYGRCLEIEERLAPGSLDVAASLNNLGNLAYRQGDLRAAHDYYSRSLEIREQLVPASLDVAGSLNGLGSVAHAQGDLAAALDYYSRSLEIREQLSPGSVDVAGSLNNLGVVASAKGDLTAALDYYRRALEIQEQLSPGSLDVAASLNNLGVVAEKQGELAAALDYHRRSLEIREEFAPGSLDVAGSLNNLGVVALARGDPAAALDYYGRSLEIRERLAPGSLLVAESSIGLADVAYAQGRLAAALDYYRRSLEIREELAPGSLAVAGSLTGLGNVAYAQGGFATALDYYGRSLEIQEQLAPGSLDVAASLNNLGGVAGAQGDLAAALDYHRRSLEIREKIAPGSLDVAASLNSLGELARKQGDLAAALDYHRRSLEIQEQLAPNSLDVAMSLNHLGNLAAIQGDLSSALDDYRRSLEIQEQLAPGSLDVAASLNNLGLVAAEQGDLLAALDYHRRSLRIRKRLAPGSLDVAASLNNLGLVAAEQGNLAAALDYYQRSLEIKKKLAPGSLLMARTLNNLGLVARKQADHGAARDYFTEAWSVIGLQGRYVMGDEAWLAFAEQHASYAANLIRAEIQAGHPVRGLAALEESRAQGLLELIDRRGLGQSAEPELWRSYKEADGRVDQLGESLARAASRTAQLERDLSDLEAQGIVGSELSPARQELSKAQAIRDEIFADYTQARVEMQTRLAKLRNSVPGLEPEALTLESARSILPRGTVYIGFSVGREATVAIIVRSAAETAVGGYVVDLTLEQLTKRVDFVRDRLGVGRVERGLALAEKSRLRSASRLLFRKLFPEDVRLVLETAERVVISPDGPLWDLPFAALDVGDDGGGSPRWLGLEMSLSYAPSLTTLAQAKRRAASSEQDSILVVGDPMPRADNEKPDDGEETPADSENPKPTSKTETAVANSNRWSERTRLFPNGVPPDPLPGAREEARRLATLYECEPLIGLEATEEVVRKRVTQATIVHLATHGYFHPTQPMSSGVLLAPSKEKSATGTDTDGALQAWEILSGLDLRADLVVLSACETGLGRAVRGEGLVGLTRALQAAGAKSVVATHWKVADDSTTELMVSFHERLRAGVRKDDALRDAMREVAGRAETSHPYFWAAFFLSGGSE